MTRRTWAPILAEAERVARSYSTAVTLRQLHYRLVASGIGGYINTETCYKQLSAVTAEARRVGTFPALSDLTRGVERPLRFESPADAIASMIAWYRRDRTEGQPFQTWMIFEKATLGAQIESWAEPYGVPSAALRGYSSESLEREIFDAMNADGRPVVGWYVGDLDPEGEDIDRNFSAQAKRMGITFKHWERLTVLPTQIVPLGLVQKPAKEDSSRANGFRAKHGELFQIEVEAVDPAELERLVRGALTNKSFYSERVRKRSLRQESLDIERLEELRGSA